MPSVPLAMLKGSDVLSRAAGNLSFTAMQVQQC